MSDYEPFDMTDGERCHPLWVRLKAHLEAELQRLRVQNDKPQTELETARLRGRIQATKALIGLGEDRPSTGD